MFKNVHALSIYIFFNTFDYDMIVGDGNTVPRDVPGNFINAIDTSLQLERRIQYSCIRSLKC